MNPNVGRATHGLLRFITGLFFMMHGGQKLLGWFAQPDWQGAPPIGSLFWIAGVLEIVGGALVMIGLGTRIVAFILSGQMAVAYFMVHISRGLFPLQNQGEAAALFCFIFLFLAGNGGGAFSVDEVLQRSRASAGRPAMART